MFAELVAIIPLVWEQSTSKAPVETAQCYTLPAVVVSSLNVSPPTRTVHGGNIQFADTRIGYQMQFGAQSLSVLCIAAQGMLFINRHL